MKRISILLLITLTALLGACKRDIPTPPPAPGDLPRVLIAASINSALPSDASMAASRVTVAHGDTLAMFEPGDAVGVFLHDEKSDLFHTKNEKYTASADTIFAPTKDIYYASYAHHNLYAYYPYSATVADATAVPVAITLDQRQTSAYSASDFMTDTVLKITPQQLTPLAPEIPMKFTHRMTSVVVRIKNGDNSLMTTLPVIKVANTYTKGSYNVVTETLSALTATMKDGRIVDSVTMRRNTRGDLAPATVCFDAIVMPQAILAGKPLIAIQFGTGASARTFDYIPRAADPIMAAGGLIAGAEHIFELTINGTELTVQGGEIVPWGTGAALNANIGGGGISLSRMIFNLAPGDMTLAATIVKADLTIDGKVRTAEVVYSAEVPGAPTVPARLTCTYNQATDWGYKLEKYTFYNADGVVVWSTQTLATPLAHLGNYNNPTYNTVIATLNSATGVVQ